MNTNKGGVSSKKNKTTTTTWRIIGPTFRLSRSKLASQISSLPVKRVGPTEGSLLVWGEELDTFHHHAVRLGHDPYYCRTFSVRLSVCACLQFTKDIVAQLDGVKIDLRGIILLEAEGKQNLLDFSEAGLAEINYADYLEEVTRAHRHKQMSRNEWDWSTSHTQLDDIN